MAVPDFLMVKIPEYLKGVKMSKLFRKPAEEFEVNGEKVHVRALPLGLVLRLKAIRKPVAEAISKLKNVGVNDFEEVTHTTPKPTEEDPEAIELMKKTSHAAPNSVAITQVTTLRSQGIEALFDCLLDENLLAEILTGSVEELKGIKPEELFSANGEQSIDIATAAELFGCIVNVNMEGFKSLGKYWSPLKSILEGVGLSK